jgi:hypothetical protein
MLIRKQLRGVLTCCAPEHESEFAPDEIAALSALALRMASARDDLLSESLRSNLQSIQTQYAALVERI